MNKDQLKGKGKDLMGRVQRQAGEWTDNPEDQAKGAGKQLEGKGQQMLGNLREAGKDLKRDLQGHDKEGGDDRKERKRNAA
ncbi:MAG: CsbD family protein [Acidobacteria bacterium]|nr:CsbD family protein [Acidobacteriota bacterium]